MKSHSSVRCLCEGAICIAIAQVLSYLPLYRFPWGGSIDLTMFPLILFCVRWGLSWGLGSCALFGMLQFFLAGGIAIGWQTVIGDYFIAFAVMGIAGLFHGKGSSIFLGGITAAVLRFLVHYVVGATLWAEYMPESFFGMTMTTPWIYSALYNGAYMLPDLVIFLVIAGVLSRPLHRYLTGQDIIGKE